jgi:hypothetical protein
MVTSIKSTYHASVILTVKQQHILFYKSLAQSENSPYAYLTHTRYNSIYLEFRFRRGLNPPVQLDVSLYQSLVILTKTKSRLNLEYFRSHYYPMGLNVY